MVALGRMARSQEKINESQKLTTQDDIVLSIPPRRDDEEKRGRKRRKNGIPTRGNRRTGSGGFESREETLNFAISTGTGVRQRDHTCKLPRYRSAYSKSPSSSVFDGGFDR